MTSYLNNSLDSFSARISTRDISLFLDYDGTLTPIVARPERAFLSFLMKRLLDRLQHIYPVAIISGRSLEDLRSRIDISGLLYSGNHGLEISSEHLEFRLKNVSSLERNIETTCRMSASMLEQIKGVIIENKGLTASIHYRLVDKRAMGKIMEFAVNVLTPLLEENGLRLVMGNKVMEIRPDISWNKGKAVMWIMERGRFKDTCPIYLGDDETDRDAFRLLQGRGISIAIGHKWDDADYFLKNQGEVKNFLDRMLMRAFPLFVS